MAKYVKIIKFYGKEIQTAKELFKEIKQIKQAKKRKYSTIFLEILNKGIDAQINEDKKELRLYLNRLKNTIKGR